MDAFRLLWTEARTGPPASVPSCESRRARAGRRSIESPYSSSSPKPTTEPGPFAYDVTRVILAHVLDPTVIRAFHMGRYQLSSLAFIGHPAGLVRASHRRSAGGHRGSSTSPSRRSSLACHFPWVGEYEVLAQRFAFAIVAFNLTVLVHVRGPTSLHILPCRPTPVRRSRKSLRALDNLSRANAVRKDSLTACASRYRRTFGLLTFRTNLRHSQRSVSGCPPEARAEPRAHSHVGLH